MRNQVRKSLKSFLVKKYLAEAGEGSGDSWSDDEDCEKSGCRKSEDKIFSEVE